MCIKFACRRNLIYPAQYILWGFIRELINMAIVPILNFFCSYIYMPLMFLGQILGGVIFYLYEKRIMSSKKEEKEEKYFMAIKLIENEKDQENDYFVPLDNKIKIIFLIFLSAFCNAVQFLLTHIIYPRHKLFSISFCPRLYGFSTLFAAFFYVYALKLPIYRHNQISLAIIGLCLIVVIILEFYFKPMDSLVTKIDLFKSLVIIIISQILIACKDSLEKYLFEYDFMDPFIVLMYEGIFGFLLSFFLFFDENYVKDVKKYENDKVALAFSLISYMILSGGKNVFRVVTNKIYSPMTKTLSDYILNPIYLWYYYGARDDFKINGNFNIWFFSINFVISIIISIFGCVYNEFIILFFCKMEHDTHYQISRRSNAMNELSEISIFDDEDEEDVEAESTLSANSGKQI